MSSPSTTQIQAVQGKERAQVEEEKQYKAHVLVKNLVDKTHKVDWSQELRVKEVRDVLKDNLPENAKLIYEGKVLQDDQTLSSLLATPTVDQTPVIYALHYPSISIDPIETAKDWDQKNRLRFFKGIHCLSVRLFEEAGRLLVDSLPTFTETAFIAYDDCVKYTMIAACMTFQRPALKKLVRSPEVMEVADKLPQYRELLLSFHECRYQDYFKTLHQVEQHIRHDWLLAQHARFITKELCIRAYEQALCPYRSLALASLAEAFGVSVEGIESDLSRYIAGGRLSCVIDQVTGVVFNNAADKRDALYKGLVKGADAMLIRLQKLNRLVSY
jgi:proteasome regulatory subunit RPN7-like protein/PCI domain-containing protein/ubiquitin domain-containing protein